MQHHRFVQVFLLVVIVSLLTILCVIQGRILRTQKVQARQELLNGYVHLVASTPEEKFHQLHSKNMEIDNLSCRDQFLVVQIIERLIFLKDAHDQDIINDSEWDAIVNDGREYFYLSHIAATWEKIKGNYSSQQQQFIDLTFVFKSTTKWE